MDNNRMYSGTPQKYAVGGFYFEPYLSHYGTKGMRWGDRKYQNKDGSLTSLGREHYGYGQGRKSSPMKRFGKKISKKIQSLNAKHNERKIEKKLTKGVSLTGRSEKNAKRRLSSLSEDEIKKLTSRLKNENMLLSEIARKEQNITDARNAKMNRQTLFSKYGKEILMKVIDKNYEERKQERQAYADLQKTIAQEKQKGLNEVEKAKQAGRNALALTKLRNLLGVNNAGDKQNAEDKKKK